jgi:hypothetical protein
MSSKSSYSNAIRKLAAAKKLTEEAYWYLSDPYMTGNLKNIQELLEDLIGHIEDQASK